jgi:formylglycine-generating enzyme
MTPDAFPPPWAARWGDDEYGLWADLEVKGVAQRMRWLAPGEFLMGSPEDEQDVSSIERPRHRVRIAQGFWMADTPCTQALWYAVQGDSPSHFKGGTLPVETIDWDRAIGFTVTLTSSLGGPAHAVLPSEAQWEFACRAGSTTRFNSGPDLDLASANIDRRFGKTLPVKSFKPNAWGLFDCHGQVWEWCADDWRLYPMQAKQGEPLVDPIGPAGSGGGAHRVRRGGSWWSIADEARAAFRQDARRWDGWYDTGFRFALRSTS